MKGQGAMEYLMTYGWALLVIVVVGAALFALGILNPGTYTQSRCSGFGYFSFQSQLLTEDDYQIEVLNGNRDITITDIFFGDTNLTIAAVDVSVNNRYIINGVADPTTKDAGDSFSETVKIHYDVDGGIEGNIDSATCVGTVQ